jgi:cytochrome c-type biogenesis protein CcmF
MPSPEKDESAYSREFWLFIGALLLTMVAGLIAIDTSWPVINKIFGTNKAITDPVPHYNRYTLWFAVVVGLLSATIQYFRYKDSDIVKFVRSLAVSTVVSAVLTGIIAYVLSIGSAALIALLFAGVFGTIANLNYLITVLKGKIKVAGASVAHIGFGILLVGILISSAKKDIISLNTTGIDYGKEFDEKNKKENILLYKDKPMKMGEYFATYKGDSIEGINTYYKVQYEKKKNAEDTPSETFMLYPHVQINPNMGMIANPATRHYLTQDIFTHVTSAPDNTQSNSKSEELKEGELAIGDTLVTKNSFIILKAINPAPIVSGYVPMPDDIAAGAKLQIVNIESKNYDAEPVYYIRNNTENRIDAEIKDLGLKIKFDKIIPEKSKIKLSVVETAVVDQFIILKAEVFPYINLVWLGSLVAVTGFLMSVHRRRKEGVKAKKA